MTQLSGQLTKEDLEQLKEALIEVESNGLIGLTDAKIAKLKKKIDAAILTAKK
jgi:hypothetical protein